MNDGSEINPDNEKQIGFAKSKLGLRAQLLITAILIVTVETGLFVGLSTLLEQQERETRRLDKAREIIDNANTILVRVYDCATVGTNFYGEGQSADFEKANIALNAAAKSRKRLQQLIQEPEQLKFLSLIDNDFRDVSQISRDIYDPRIKDDDSTVENDLNKFRRMRVSVGRLTKDIDALIDEQRGIEKESPRITQDYKGLVKNSVLLGLIINGIFVLGGSLWFSKSVLEKLTRIFENSYLFALGKELNPRLTGKDEISQIDGLFHDMAGEISKEQQRLKASESRIKTILDRMPVGILVCARNGAIEFANPKLCHMLDHTPKDLNGKPLTMLFSAIDADARNAVQKLLTSTRQLMELDALNKSGDIIKVECSCDSFASDDGIKQIIMIADVTERYELQQKRQAFMQMVNHDIRAPLSAIGGLFELMTRGAFGELPETLMQRADSAEQSTARLGRMVNELLELEKLESGVLNLRVCNIDLENMMSDAVATVETLAQAKDITIKQSSDNASDTLVPLDGERMMQVLINLLSNAIKFAPEHSIVELSAVVAPKALTMVVSDQGMGVPDERKKLIFERFSQLERKDPMHKREGFGLGLAICKAIVEQHGGTIRCEDAEPKGSQFIISVPLSGQVT